MLISPAWAHGTAGAAADGVGPMILLGIAVVAALFFIGRKTWRARQKTRDDG